MPKKVIKLNSVVRAPKFVEIEGTEYRLPGDIPIELVALMERLEAGDDEQVTVRLQDELLSLFRRYQPDLKRLPLGLSEAVEALGIIYEPDDDGDVGGGEDEPDPTTPSTSRKSRKKSSSSRS